MPFGRVPASLTKYPRVASVVMLLLASCAARRGVGSGSFQVLRGTPEYLLRSPNSTEMPFPELLNQYRNQGVGWVDLRSQMELRIEAAYYREGSVGRSPADYLGTEIARFQVRSNGRLRLASLQS